MSLAPVRTGKILVSFLSAFLYIPAATQTAHPVQEAGEVRLASPEEGEAVVLVAWELRRGLAAKPDCSHFVHLVYAQAGLDYEYASTREIFEGTDPFQRVQKPQPGDLAVWQGHVGIVVDPAEHSFYSSVRSGFALEDYRSGYWSSRGPLRFYRYLMDDAHSARLAVHLKTTQLSASPTLSGSNLTEPRSFAEADALAVPRPLEASNIPDAIFVSAHARPSQDEVRAAVIKLADANSKRTSGLPVLHSSRTIVIADQIAVGNLDIHDDSGWVELEVKSGGAVRCASNNPNQVTARWRETVRREERGWILLASPDRVYLRRDRAVQVLAEQVARMSRAATANQAIKNIVKTLDDLVSGESMGPIASVP